MMRQYVLKGDICFSRSQTELEIIENGYLVCVDGVSKGAFHTLPEEYAALPLQDYGGKLIIPGLTDLHAHAPQYAFRALGMDMELLDWLNSRAFPEEAKYQDLDYAERAYSMFVEDLRKSPNTRACIFATRHVPATELLMEKLEESGLVSMVGKVNMDRNSHPDLQEKSCDDSAQDTIKWLDDCAERYKRTTPIITPRFIPSCSDSLMQKLRVIARERALPVQSHLSENPSENAWVRELCPNSCSYSDAYRHFGLFGGETPTIMAHCVWVDEPEMELMAQNGVFVAHCPQSNANLCSGIAPVRRFLQRGIKTGLGSDVAGGAHLSIFRAMSDAVQASKLRWRMVDQSLAPLTLEEVFYLGTVGGGAFFGQVGSFAPGYEFDALVIDDASLRAPFELTLPERLARVVYFSENCRISAKYVRGTPLLK